MCREISIQGIATSVFDAPAEVAGELARSECQFIS
jgi:hypothetical protein